MRDLTTEVAEIRKCLIGCSWDPYNAFPRMAGYPDIPCERVFRRTLDLVRIYTDQIRAGSAPRISACCRALRTLARGEAVRGLEAYRSGWFIAGKPKVDMHWVRDQAKWLGWLIGDAVRAGRKLKGRETDLAVDVLGLIRELIQDMPWTKLPKDSLRHRVGLVRWFGDEVQRIAGLPSSRPDSSSNRPAQTSTARITPAGPSRDTSDAGGTRSATEHV